MAGRDVFKKARPVIILTGRLRGCCLDTYSRQHGRCSNLYLGSSASLFDICGQNVW